MIIGTRTLYPHQVRAVEWMMERETDDTCRGGFLCDDMGLGKTWSVLGLLHSTADSCPRTLILCPLVLIGQWTAGAIEAGFTVYHYPSSHRWTMVGHAKPVNRGTVYIANFERIHERESTLIEFDRLVIDEAHVLRNGFSKRYEKIYELAKEVPRTWCLTGTPLVNRLEDVQSLYRLVRGNKRAGTIGSFDGALDVMSTYALRRSVEDVGAALSLGPRPDDTHIVLDFETDAEASFYRMIQGQIQRQLEAYEAFDVGNAAVIFKLLLRLRQISIHPQVYIQGQRRTHGVAYTRADWSEKSSTKVNGLLDLLSHQTLGHNWVVFCNFQDEIELLRGVLMRQPYIGTVSTYHGKKRIEERAATLQEHRGACERNTDVPVDELYKLALPDDVCRHIYGFMAPVQNVILVQIHCGGTGLNLQENDRVVFMSPWWTSALMKQAVARVYRMGQRKHVQVYRLMLKEEASLNIDKRMMSKALEKEELCVSLLEACAKN
jgi:SNF2 family DNA or RNA helicase